MKMKAREYRKWIEAGYKNYGEDPWFFIRELAQNSRDAGASNIQVTSTHTQQNGETLIFEDNGEGMTYAHALKYLFRLYASSKTKEKNAAGMFGFGFWTVLKFEPATILIESFSKGESWGVQVDAELNTNHIAGTLDTPGTRITLVRPAKERTAEAFADKIGGALDTYCSYLRRNNRKAGPLPVFFQGRNITRAMTLPGPVAWKFKKNGIEGAAGLGPRPSVKLYARGLPVWEGTTLEELSHTPPVPGDNRKHKQRETEIFHGLAPVFLLNGNHLEVNISRRRVIDNRHLQKLRKAAEDGLAQMVEMAADSVSPRSLVGRLVDTLKKAGTYATRSFFKTLIALLMILIPLEIYLLTTFYKTTPGQAPTVPVSIRTEDANYPGASVRTASTAGQIDLTYTPARDAVFKLYSAGRYDISKGFVPDMNDSHAVFGHDTFPLVDCSQNNLSMILNTHETGRLFLPVPGIDRTPGSASFTLFIDPASITVNGVPIQPGTLGRYPGGETIVNLSDTGTIAYTCCPPVQTPALSPSQHQRYTQLPANFRWPAGMREEFIRIERHAGKTTAEKVFDSVGLTVSLLKYDDSPVTAQKYSEYRIPVNGGDWLKMIAEIGVGDCDVLNGVTVIFLRKMGIPSRMVIGLVGREGTVLPGLHAWVEYFDDGWRLIDATQFTAAVEDRIPAAGSHARPAASSTIPDNGRWQKVRRIAGYFFIILVSGVIVLLLLLTAARRRNTRKTFAAELLPQVQQDLAGMVMHDLLHPGAWGHDRGIRRFHLIPEIGGGFVSLTRALKQASKQRLFTVRSSHPLARHLQRQQVSGNALVLDSGNSAFAPVIKLLPGAVHLEHILELKAVEPEHAPDARLSQLLRDVNRLLYIENKHIPVCWPAAGLQTVDFFDVDLSPLPSMIQWGIPNRFIAVNPWGRLTRKIVMLYSINPLLAQFRFIEAVLKESNLVPPPSEAILESISRKMSRKFHETTHNAAQ